MLRAFSAEAPQKMAAFELSWSSMRHPAKSNALVLRALVLHLTERFSVSTREHCVIICKNVLSSTPKAFLPQHRHDPFTYVVDSESVFTHYDVAWSRRAISVYAQHVATIADVAMPALRRTRLDGKPRVDRGQ